MNIRRMYKEYSIVCEFKRKKVLSEWKSQHIFNTEFNLGFHPKKQTHAAHATDWKPICNRKQPTLRKKNIY